MHSQQPAGLVRVAGQRRVHERSVLGHQAGIRAGRNTHDVTVTVTLHPQRVAKLDEPARTAPGDQRLMKFPVPRFPLGRDGHAPAFQARLCPRQLVMRGDNLGFPFVVAAFDRLAQSDGLDLAARLHDIEEVLDGSGRDAETMIDLEVDEAFAGKPRKSLPQR